MKKIVLCIGLIFPAILSAQQNQSFGTYNKQVVCAPVDVILKGLASPDVKELPLWIGKDETEKSEYVVFVNTKTKAFTVVQIGTQIGCILGLGYDSYLVEDKKL